jgi:multimeric flavodoxin WrbA
MKVLGICCSPNPHGHTQILMAEALKGAQSEGAEIEFYSMAGKNIQPCLGCFSCAKTGKCKVQDDLPELQAKMAAAGGLIFGSPVYYYGMTAQAKCLLDRSQIFAHPQNKLANKVGGMIVTAGSLGVADTLKDFYFYMITRQIIPASFVAAYPEREGFTNMPKCLKASFDLGRQIVKILEKGPVYPVDIASTHVGFGTHTK